MNADQIAAAMEACLIIAEEEARAKCVHAALKAAEGPWEFIALCTAACVLCAIGAWLIYKGKL